MRFPDDGEYVFPGALATLVVRDGSARTWSRTPGSIRGAPRLNRHEGVTHPCAFPR